MSSSSFRDRFGKLLDTAGQFFWELDRSFRVTFANDLFKRTFGDPVGKICHQFMSGKDEICPDCPVKKIYEGAERAVSETPRYDKSGKKVWLQHTATPIRNEDGDVIGASELTIDTTHRRQTEEWLKDSERLYRNLVEQVPDVIFSLDDQGRFTFVNTQVEKFLGYPVQQILETPLQEYVAAEDQERVQTMLHLEPDRVWDEEVGIVDAEGKKKFARIRCKASYNSGSRLLGFEGVMRDRTVRRKLEENLKASRQELATKIKIIDDLYQHVLESGKCKAIDGFTADVAHELRQPMAIVGGFARRLARKLESDEPFSLEKQKQYTNIIISEIQRLEEILDQLIDYTKRHQLRLQRANPNDLIEYILAITEGRRQEKDIELKVSLGPEIGEVPLDPGRFQQLVLNLVSNALDASPVCGVIELETGVSIPSDAALKAGELESAGFFEMKVRNSGARISPEALQKIFNPFYTTKPHGTGLGLAVSRRIVEAHEGSISVKSDDHGTVFTVWLPFIRAEEGTSGFCMIDESTHSKGYS